MCAYAATNGQAAQSKWVNGMPFVAPQCIACRLLGPIECRQICGHALDAILMQSAGCQI